MPATESDCVFCKIVDGAIPCTEVYQDEQVLAFMDINPLADGHVLLIPRVHCEQVGQMPPEAVGRLFSHVGRIGKAVVSATGADGFNVLQNNGQVSGQVVMHVHVHVIPRVQGDGLGYRWPAGSYPAGRAEALAKAIAAAL